MKGAQGGDQIVQVGEARHEHGQGGGIVDVIAAAADAGLNAGPVGDAGIAGDGKRFFALADQDLADAVHAVRQAKGGVEKGGHVGLEG